MKKFTFLVFGLFLSASITQAQTFQNTTPTTAVDGITRITGGCGYNTDPGVEMSEIAVSTVGTIGDPTKITINLSLDAAWLGDVVVELVSPNGEGVTLIRRLGANGAALCGDSSNFVAANILSFNSANTAQIEHLAGNTAYDIPSGNYLPSFGNAKYPVYAPTDLGAFLTGKTLNGNWRLVVYDHGTGDATTLQSWQMIVATGATLKTIEGGTFGSEIALKQNPVKDYLYVDVTSDFKSLELEIFDASGKRIQSENILKNAKNVQLDVRNLALGMYLLTPTKDGQRKQAIKFIKK